MKEKICKKCKISFKPWAIGAKYCSPKCFYLDAKKGEVRNCKFCGKIFYVLPGRINKGDRYKSCSRECYYNSLRKGIYKKCRTCQKRFYSGPSDSKFGKGIYCSEKCHFSRRPKNLKALKTRLWAVCSAYIRTRDKGICFTCGRYGEGSAYHAGHYIPSAVCGVLIRYDERNIHGQCYNCNVNLGGWGAMYHMKMIEKFGEKLVKELWKIKDGNHEKKWSVSDYIEKIDYYEKKLNSEFGFTFHYNEKRYLKPDNQ